MKPARTFLAAILVSSWALRAADTTLRYDKPAASWMTEALPVGNGELGAMVFGKTEIERVQFNEKSLWMGNEYDTGSYQPVGDLFIELGHTQPQEYRRELDLARGAQTVSYVSNGVIGARSSRVIPPALSRYASWRINRAPSRASCD